MQIHFEIPGAPVAETTVQEFVWTGFYTTTAIAHEPVHGSVPATVMR